MGFVDRGFDHDEPHAVSVYEDGRILVAEPDAPYGFVTGDLDPSAMERLDEVADGVDPDADYGEVMVTDVGETVVTIGGTPPATISVWALAHTDGLDDDQRAAREELQGLVDELVQAGGEATADGEPYVPERVDVHISAVPPDETVTAEPWPLAEPPEELRRPPRSGAWCFDVTADDAPAPDRVLPRELPGRRGWDSTRWTRWSWFDVRVVATEIDGRRYLDVHATCTPYVTDEEPVCTIDARLDPRRGDVVEFTAS